MVYISASKLNIYRYFKMEYNAWILTEIISAMQSQKVI